MVDDFLPLELGNSNVTLGVQDKKRGTDNELEDPSHVFPNERRSSNLKRVSLFIPFSYFFEGYDRVLQKEDIGVLVEIN